MDWLGIRFVVVMEVNKRFWEIDFLRGAAVVMMIVFHFLYDLDYFGACQLVLHAGFWSFFAKLTAAIFIFLAGVSLSLSHSRALMKKERRMRMKYMKRGALLFSMGLAITLLTWIFLGDDFVVFGILHFIGLSVVLAYPFLGQSPLTGFIAGSLSVVAGFCLRSFHSESALLVALGLAPHNFHTVDLFPLFPWFGLVLFGLSAGKILYGGYERRFSIPGPGPFLAGKFCFLGRNSLAVYFLHQPVLIVLLLALGIISLDSFAGQLFSFAKNLYIF